MNISIFSATITLNAGSGNGTNNEWNTGGTTVGDDCAQQGGTAANTGTKNDNLVTPLDGPAASGTITSIEVRVYAKADIDLSGTGDGIRVRIMSVYSEGIDATTDELTTSYAYYSHIFTTDPNTSAAWTWSGIISLEVGCRAIAGGKQDFSQLDVDHIEVIVNYNAEPVLTGLTGEDTLSSSECFQRTDGTGNVEINYRVSDADHSTVTVTVEYWNGTWNAAEDTYISGDKGSVDATSSTTDRQILWNAANELGAVEVTDYNIRVTATDASSDADQISLASNSLTIDTKEPTGYGCGTPSDGASPGPGNVTLESSVASDAGTVSYYFEIDDNATFLSPSASGWQEADNNWVSSGMVAGQTYYWHVKVRDSYGNETAYSSSFSFTVSNVKPTVSVNSVTEADNGTGLVTVNYNLEDPQNPENCKLLLEFSVDNKSTWNQAYISSASVGSIDNTGVGAGSSTGQITGISTNVSNQTFVWDSKNSGNEGGSQNNSEYSDVYFRITPEDVSSNTGATITSISFVLDNKVPSGYDCTTPANLSTNISLSPTLA
ncbi:MAG: hypothetical protein PVI26_10610, partial [Chitinispirillia bacterium]